MPPHTPQFTPAQVVQAGRRAEKDGKPDLAAHFYRHVVEHYGASPEAAEARESLSRLTARQSGDVTTPPSPPPEAGHEASPPPPPPTLEPQPAIAAPAIELHSSPNRHYAVGRFCAGLIVILGWLTLASGLLLLAVASAGTSTAWLPTWAVSPAALVPTLGWATMQGLGGLVMILAGQVARAIFDIAAAATPDNLGGEPDRR